MNSVLPLNYMPFLLDPKTGQIYTPNTDKTTAMSAATGLTKDEVRAIMMMIEEKRFNPNHDPTNGQFTGSSGGVTNKMLTKEQDIFEKEESPRKNKAGNYAVDWSNIQTQEYSDKFKQISDNTVVANAIETRVKWALNNRDGSDTEELYAVSLDNGREISRITDQNYSFGVKRTEKFANEISEADKAGERILFIHNHPNGYPPSVTDINNLLENDNAIGITVGHNGSVYLYTKPHSQIDNLDYLVQLRHCKEFTKITNMEKALEGLSKKYGFEIKKL